MGFFKKINKLGRSPVKKKSAVPRYSGLSKPKGGWGDTDANSYEWDKATKRLRQEDLKRQQLEYRKNVTAQQDAAVNANTGSGGSNWFTKNRPSGSGTSLEDKWAAARQDRTGSTGYQSGGAAGYVPGQDPGGYWGPKGNNAQANAFAQAQRRGEADLSYARGLAGKVMSDHEARNAMGAAAAQQSIRDIINSGRRRQQVANALLEDPLSYNERAKQQMYEGAAGQINTAYQQGENQLLRGMAGRGAVTPAQREAALARMSMGKGEALGGARREIETGAALQRPTDIINALGAGNMTGQAGMNLASGRQNIINAQLQGSIAAQQPMQNILGSTTYNPFMYGAGGGGGGGGVSSDSLTSFLQKYFPG